MALVGTGGGKDIRMLCVVVYELTLPLIQQTLIPAPPLGHGNKPSVSFWKFWSSRRGSQGRMQWTQKGGSANRLGKLRGWRGEGIKEDFTDEGELLLRPGTQVGFYGGMHFMGRNNESQGTGVGPQ